MREMTAMTSMACMQISWNQILQKIKDYSPNESCELVIGIATSGSLPAALVAAKLAMPLELIEFCKYAPAQKPGVPPKLLHETPMLKKIDANLAAKIKGKRVLLVDDFCKTGSTLNAAKKLLIQKGAKSVETLSFSGNPALADQCFFESQACVEMPWQTR